MMNKRIRSMIDEIFSEMKMTAENLALRDELMANAQARYEDVIAAGKSEEEAFAEVAASLEDVQELLGEMNGIPAEDMQEPAEEKAADVQPDTPSGEKTEESKGMNFDLDLGDTLNKAFTALSDFGQSIMPQAKKLVRQMDDVTGGVIKNMGKAVDKGVKDAQKTASDALDKMSNMSGELVFDFGKKEEPAHKKAEKTPEEMREEAKDLRAQAEIKQVTGDQEGARELRAQAYALETQADALEVKLAEEAMKAAQAEAAKEAAGSEAETPESSEATEEAPVLEEKHEPVLDAEGDVNEDAFSKVVEQIQKDTKKVLNDAEAFIRDAVSGEAPAEDAAYTASSGEEASSGSRLFPAAGLRAIDIQLDADDVRIEAAEGDMIETVWTARNVDGQPEIWMEGHKLVIRRKNPDVFKTFFSVFSKDGGQITVRVPRGYAADYKVSTTSGDIHLYEIDVDSVKVNSTSGSVRVEPDAAVRADEIKADTVSGHVTISACAVDVKANTVSGNQFISCDADKVDVDTVSGRIHVEGACEEWKVDSVSGGVELLCTVVPTKKIDIDTVSATARVALPGDIRGFVAKLSGMGGKVVNEFGPNHYGTCALPIQMDSMSGSLMITRL